MTDRFAACLAETSILEGGWSDDPQDPGGPTMRGITIRVYAGFLGIRLTARGKALVQDAAYGAVKAKLRNITDAEIVDIYRRNYWNAARCDELPVGIDFTVWDMSVIAGPPQAVKSLQKVLGVTVDGHIGAATMGALKARAPVDLVRAYLAERRAFHRQHPKFWHFGKGWLARCDRVEMLAIDMANGVAAVVDRAVLPPVLLNPDAQSATQGRATPEPLLGSTGVVTQVQGIANGFTKVAAMKEPAWHAVALAFLSEPLVLAGVVTLTAALTTWLWRRKFA